MEISLICAASANGVIGIDNRLPWHLPADLKRFKQLTWNHPILLGRKTFESIGKPLPGRTNIVVTGQPGLKICGALTAASLEEAFRLCADAPEIFVIGGGSLYAQTLPYAQKIYLTRIHQQFEGDTFLVPIDPDVWKETSREDFQPDAQNPYPYSFLILQKK